MTVFCITNDRNVDDLRPCTRLDEHLEGCTGTVSQWSARARRYVKTGKPCTGCVPRKARRGLLCLACVGRVEHAFVAWTPLFEATLENLERAVQHDNSGVRSSTEGHIPIPGTRLAVDEIRSYLTSFPGNIDDWVRTRLGAMDAVRFARAVPAAVRTHEIEERAHLAKKTRCTKCKQLSLVWNPPQAQGDHVRVVCSSTLCGTEINQSSFEAIAQIEESGKGQGATATCCT